MRRQPHKIISYQHVKINIIIKLLFSSRDTTTKETEAKGDRKRQKKTKRDKKETKRRQRGDKEGQKETEGDIKRQEETDRDEGRHREEAKKTKQQ